jgi:hypothetical protein
MANQFDGRVAGYIELSEYPDFPSQKFPTKADCAGYKYISMKQLCALAEHHDHSLHAACDAFGGNKGRIAVQPDRQARYIAGHQTKKFVLVSAVEDYFKILGIKW